MVTRSIAVGLAALFLLLFAFISRSLVAPVTQLAEAARKVAKGERELRVRPGSLPETRELAVAFNAIKHNALALLCTDIDIDALCEKLTEVFLTSPCSQRPDRNPPRRKTSDRALLDYHRRRKKHCY